MAVRIRNNRAASPLGIAGGCNNSGRVIAQSSERRIYRWDLKANASAQTGCTIGRKRIKLENATRETCSEMLRPASVSMLGKLQTETRVESDGALNVWGPQHNEIDCDVVHGMRRKQSASFCVFCGQTNLAGIERSLSRRQRSPLPKHRNPEDLWGFVIPLSVLRQCDRHQLKSFPTNFRGGAGIDLQTRHCTAELCPRITYK